MMDIYTFRENSTNFKTPCKKKRASCLMRDEIARSNSACNEFHKEMSVMKLRYPFLTESQIKGRTMDKFGIPNIMGRPYKYKSGSVTYSTVNHVLYLIRRSITERKGCSRNSDVKRRHTISGAYIPLEIITTKCDQRNNHKSRKNLEKKFSLYSEENDMSDDDYSIESSSEYSRGMYSDAISQSEIGNNIQSYGDEVLEHNSMRKTYERKSLDNYPPSTNLNKNNKRVSEVDNANGKKLACNHNLKTPKDTFSNFNLIDRDDNENDKEVGELRENHPQDNESRNEEAFTASDTNSFDFSYSSQNMLKGKSVDTQNVSKRESSDHELAIKIPTKSSRNPEINFIAGNRANPEIGHHRIKESIYVEEKKSDEENDELQVSYEKDQEKGKMEIRKENCNKIKYLLEKTILSRRKKPTKSSQSSQMKSANVEKNSETGDCNFEETFHDIENEEIEELQIIYENLALDGSMAVIKEQNSDEIEHLQENQTASEETPSIVEDSQNITYIYNKKPKYIKQSISICSSEYLWQDGSQSSAGSSSIVSEAQILHKYYPRSRLRKISIPFTSMDQFHSTTSSQSNSLEDYKRRRGYCRKISESIIVIGADAWTDSEHNDSVDGRSTTSGENSSQSNALMDHPHDSDDSCSDTNDTKSPASDVGLEENGRTDLNVAFSPHFVSQNMSVDYSDGYLSSQEMSDLNSEKSERNTTNEMNAEGYYLANLFDDDNLIHQRTLRSTSAREAQSEEDEPTFVD